MNILDVVTGGWLTALRERRRHAACVEHERRRWRSIAERYGLAFHPGPYRGYFQGDRIEGRIDGRAVRVQSDADYDLQNLVVTVSVECDAREVEAPMDLELVPWVSGQRAGIGAVLDHRERTLIYRQLYKIDEQTLELLLAKLPSWAHQLELAI